MTFVPLRWSGSEMTGELRQIHISADRIHIAVLQTDQQKGAYPAFESSGIFNPLRAGGAALLLGGAHRHVKMC
ncbi:MULTISPECIES: hypothetical protein [unclassified Rhodococcus (in: high G+C Gram-positive bacteria)]|uniref:hypothetical protein n=1 Tax=unclassified Rhodococcus (in: high G+C Gram-positive bacteria) TaxID=192944 RepID=UPI001268DAA9|nr:MULTISPECIES: hypothetical protein [unclassified Rhodococcus (in: high G+C Gram-positive bacteria)]MCJ0894400.1 hypothetical protein [Rhodococcus sp. ARC_M5]